MAPGLSNTGLNSLKKSFSRRNTLAYHAVASATNGSGFIGLAPGVDEAVVEKAAAEAGRAVWLSFG